MRGDSSPSLSLLNSVLGVGSLGDNLRRRPQDEQQWRMSQCLEHFCGHQWGPGTHHQAKASSGVFIPHQHSPATADVPTGEVQSSEKGSGRRGKPRILGPSESGGCGPSAADPAAPESLNQETLKKSGGIFMCVTCISTCVHACTFTHSYASTLKYLQSAHMWMCLHVSPCAWEIRSCVWSCMPEHLWSQGVLLGVYTCGWGAR